VALHDALTVSVVQPVTGGTVQDTLTVNELSVNAEMLQVGLTHPAALIPESAVGQTCEVNLEIVVPDGTVVLKE
jgi:hypothetical protein